MRTKFKKLIIQCISKIYKTIRYPILIYQKKFNIKTRGVRILVLYQNKVLLVRHWYNGLWVMPGGGVGKNETPEYASIRELKEEISLELTQLDYLLGAYSNTREGKNDTVYCYVVELEKPFEIKKRFNLEISEIAWFDIENLPKSTSKATCDRVFEYIHRDIQMHIRPWS